MVGRSPSSAGKKVAACDRATEVTATPAYAIASLSFDHLTREDVLEFLRSRHLDVVADSVTAVGHGEWSRAFYFTTRDHQDRVVRFSATNDDFLKDRRAE